MLFVNLPQAFYNASMSFLQNHPRILKNYPSFTAFDKSGFDETQKTYLIGSLALSALTAVGGLFSAYINRKGSFKTNAMYLATSALGAAAFVMQYHFLGSTIPTTTGDF